MSLSKWPPDTKWRPPDISGGRHLENEMYNYFKWKDVYFNWRDVYFKYISPVEIYISSHDNIYLVLALVGFHNN